MTDQQHPDEGESELVFPFVVCQTQGGPFNDKAFVAGAQFGTLFRRLETGEDDPVLAYVDPELVRQLDLAAAHCAYRMTVEPWDEHWTLVTFEKITNIE